jgi:D-alanine-D-alanine ligase
MELHLLNQSMLVRNSTKEIAPLLNESTKILWDDLPSLVDFVFIGLHGGKGENGAVQGALEMLGIPYNGSGVLTSSLCMDKYKTAQTLKDQGFSVPAQYYVERDVWKKQSNNILDTIERSFTYPLVVKPHDDGCSVMVEKVKMRLALAESIESIMAKGKEGALVEEFINGMELTVGVIGNNKPRALPPTQTVITRDILSIEEKFLPGAGENLTPAPLPTEILHQVQDVIARAYSALGCKGYARIDCFYQSAAQSPTQKDRVIILEVNTLPGMTPATCIFHQAAEIGMKPMDFIDTIIELGFEEHGYKHVAISKELVVENKKEIEKLL